MENLLKALQLIKETCTEQERCQKCPLSSDDECLITQRSSSDWDVQDKPIIKLLLF